MTTPNLVEMHRKPCKGLKPEPDKSIMQQMKSRNAQKTLQGIETTATAKGTPSTTESRNAQKTLQGIETTWTISRPH